MPDRSFRINHEDPVEVLAAAQGATARDAEGRLTVCPYDGRTRQGKAWLAGWHNRDSVLRHGAEPEMKLWLLQRIGDADWDEYLGFVVRAATEDEARRLAWTGTSTFEAHREGWWLDANQTTCVELHVPGEPGVILDSYKAG